MDFDKMSLPMKYSAIGRATKASHISVLTADEQADFLASIKITEDGCDDESEDHEYGAEYEVSDDESGDDSDDDNDEMDE